MKKQAKIILIISALMLTTVACGAFLEGDREIVTARTPTPYEPVESPPQERIEISDYYELSAEILSLILEHENVGLFVTYNFDIPDIQEEVDRAIEEIETYNPIGAFATSSISAITRRTAAYTEIDVFVEFKRTQEQVNSIIPAATIRYLRTELLGVLREHRDEVAFRTSLNITEDDIRDFMKEMYYDNPRSIIMLPVVALEAFPAYGEDRIIELRFGHIEPSSILQQYVEILSANVRYNAGLAVGGNDAEILLTLARNLIASTTFDEAAARAISDHGPQNFAATAFGALERGNAVGEGFAMAFKALADELGFDCRIVLGYRDGMVHAWNIVSLFGEFYHIDVAMGALYGLENSFLKTDDDFIEMLYEWDFENTVRCNGTLTYEDIVYLEDDMRYNEIDDAIVNDDEDIIGNYN